MSRPGQHEVDPRTRARELLEKLCQARLELVILALERNKIAVEPLDPDILFGREVIRKLLSWSGDINKSLYSE